MCGAGGVGRGGGGGGGGNFLYICHSTDVRAEWPFKRCQLYDWPPFFSTKSICMTRFFRIPM